MALHIQFAQTALGVQRRYYRLNLAIKNTFALSKLAFICKLKESQYQYLTVLHWISCAYFVCIETLLEKASNVKKDKVTTEPGDQRTETIAGTPRHETNFRSNVNVSHMSAKSVIKIATLSRATALEENQSAPNILGTSKTSTALPTISFGIAFLDWTAIRGGNATHQFLNHFIFSWKGKLGGTVAITRASFFLDRLAYTHAILGETVTLISKYVEMCFHHIDWLFIIPSYYMEIPLFLAFIFWKGIRTHFTDNACIVFATLGCHKLLPIHRIARRSGWYLFFLGRPCRFLVLWRHVSYFAVIRFRSVFQFGLRRMCLLRYYNCCGVASICRGYY